MGMKDTFVLYRGGAKQLKQRSFYNDYDLDILSNSTDEPCTHR